MKKYVKNVKNILMWDGCCNLRILYFIYSDDYNKKEALQKCPYALEHLMKDENNNDQNL